MNMSWHMRGGKRITEQLEGTEFSLPQMGLKYETKVRLGGKHLHLQSHMAGLTQIIGLPPLQDTHIKGNKSSSQKFPLNFILTYCLDSKKEIPNVLSDQLLNPSIY